MSIGVTTALAIGGIVAGGVGAASSLAAGSEQANASKSAAQLQAEEAQNALNFQEQQWGTQQANEAPFLKAGQGAVQTLSGLIPGMNAADAAYPQFQAPTAEQARQTPGYQFAMQQGLQGVQNSAAARGGLLSGNTLAATEQYGQGLADTNYQQTYNNALQGYQQSYNQFQNQQANTYNRYATLAGLGSTTAGQLGSQGQAASGNVADISLTAGAQQAQQLNNQAAATASGYVGAGNAVSSGINNLSQTYLLSQLLNQGKTTPIDPNAGAYPGDV